MNESELFILAREAVRDDLFRGRPPRSMDQIMAEIRAETVAQKAIRQ